MIEKYYEPKFLYGVIKELEPVNAYFRKNFFNDTITFPTESVTFERMNSDRGILPFSDPNKPAPVISRKGYSARIYTPPLISGGRMINLSTLEQKIAGETPYNSGLSPEDRAAEIAANDLAELQAQIQRKEEYLCAQLKQNGKIIVDADSFDGVIEYGFTNIEVTQSSDKWTSSYDILGKLKEKNVELLHNGVNADMLIMGYQAAAALMSNTKIAKLMDNRRMNFGEIAPEKFAQGVQYLGRLIDVGLYLDLYCYADFYNDYDHGTIMPYLNTDCVIMQSSQEKDYMLYGAVTYIDHNGEDFISSNEYVPYIVTTQDPPTRKLIVASRPLPMPAKNNSWYVLKEVV